jgi:hypothetical protein
VVNQIIEEASGEAYWKARVESQGKAAGCSAAGPGPRNARNGHDMAESENFVTSFHRDFLLFVMGNHHFFMGSRYF